MQIGDKVIFGNDKTPATITKLYKNGKARIEFWAQGGFMPKPELWKDTVKVSENDLAPPSAGWIARLGNWMKNV